MTPNQNDPTAFTPPGGGTLLGHPKGLFVLFMVEMWERFSYYGMRGLLVIYLMSVMSVKQAEPGVYVNKLELKQVEENPADKDKPFETIALRDHVVIVGSGSAPQSAAWENKLKLQLQKLVRNPSEKPDDLNDDWMVEGAEDGAAHVVRVQKDGKVENGSYALRVSNPTDKPLRLVAQIAREENPPGAEIATRTYFTVNDSTGSATLEVKPDKDRSATDPTYDIIVKAHEGDSGRNWTGAHAKNLYGWYGGFIYLLPIIGGLIADKLIGTHRSMLVGAVLITLGHLALGASGFGSLAQDAFGMTIFVFGLGLIIVGTGHFKPSVSVMVGQLYAPGDPRRESAFSWFYMGINLGAFLCNLVCGYLAEQYGWHYGFGAAAVGMVLGLLMYLWGKPLYLQGVGEPEDRKKANVAWAFLPIGCVLAAGLAIAFKLGWLNKVDQLLSTKLAVGIISAAAIGYAVWFIASQEKQDRGPVITIFVYMLFNAVFWLAFEQAGSSLTVFADVFTQRQLSSTFTFPTAWFQSVNPLFIILFTPIAAIVWAWLSKRKVFIPQPGKIGLGLIFVGLGYVIMVMAALRLNTGLPKVGLIYICATYFLHTVGEIILSPTGLSYVAKTAPKRHVSSLMGIWFISSFIAGLAAGKVAALTEPIMEGKIKLPWKLGGQADFFLLFVITSIAAGVLLLAISPLLATLQRDKRD